MASDRRPNAHQLVKSPLPAGANHRRRLVLAGAKIAASWCKKQGSPAVIFVGSLPKLRLKITKKRPKIMNFRPRSGTFPAEARAMFLSNIY